MMQGMSCFGVGDLSSLKDTIVAQGGVEVGRYRYCISIGIVLPHAVVDTLPNRDQISVMINYKQQC